VGTKVLRVDAFYPIILAQRARYHKGKLNVDKGIAER